MVSRYDNREIGINQTEQYEELLSARGRKKIIQYFTAELYHPTAEDIQDLDIISLPWEVGSAYYKLADKYYGESKLWWIIAWFNQKPTDAHVKIGDIIDIPLPLESILRILKV